MRNRVITLILLTRALAIGVEAARFDEPTPLQPDGKVSEGAPETTPHLPAGTSAGVPRSADNPQDKLPAGDLRWFKGNTHTHSLWSDGNDFPEMIADWYKTRGYNFLVLSDHNMLSAGERWMRVAEVEKRKRVPGPAVMPKYVARFGREWVETRGEGASEEVRLRTLAEIRPKFEEPERFLMIEGEEITDRYQGAQIHINAINLSKAIAPRHGNSIQDTMRNNLRAVLEEEAQTGRPILPHLNHPNFQWSVTATDIAEVLEERFVEIYNGHPATHHLGDATRPGDEMNFDLANTLRLTRLKSEPLYAVATDDSHTYHGGDASPGRGWVMVRAASLRAEDLIAAMRAGDFYASSGVTLNDLRFDAATGELRIEIEPDGDATYVTRFIGTLAAEPENCGRVLDTASGLVASYKLSGAELYVRATVTSSLAHANPSFKGQQRQAWTQPVGWKKPRP
jgi:hypothetical protein